MAGSPVAAAVDLGGAIAQILAEDVHDRPVAVAYVGDDGRPNLSFRGSSHVHGPQQFAIWARGQDSGLAASVASRPDVSVLLFKPSTHTRSRVVVWR